MRKSLSKFLKSMQEHFENTSHLQLADFNNNITNYQTYETTVNKLYRGLPAGAERDKQIKDLTMKSMKEFVNENFKKMKESLANELANPDSKFPGDGNHYTPAELFYHLRDMCAQMYGPYLNMKDQATRQEVMNMLRAPYQELQKEYANPNAVNDYVNDLKQKGKYDANHMMGSLQDLAEDFDEKTFCTDPRSFDNLDAHPSINDIDNAVDYGEESHPEERFAERKQALQQLCTQYKAMSDFHNSRNRLSRALHRGEANQLQSVYEKLDYIRKNDPDYNGKMSFDEFLKDNINPKSEKFKSFDPTDKKPSDLEGIKNIYTEEANQEIKQEISDMKIRTQNEYKQKHPELSQEKVDQHFKLYNDAYQKQFKEEAPTVESLKKENDELKERIGQVQGEIEKLLDLVKANMGVQPEKKEVAPDVNEKKPVEKEVPVEPVDEAKEEQEQQLNELVPPVSDLQNEDAGKEENEIENNVAPLSNYGDLNVNNLDDVAFLDAQIGMIRSFSEANPNLSFADAKTLAENLTANKSVSQIVSEQSAVFDNKTATQDFFKEHPNANVSEMTEFYKKNCEEVSKQYEGKEQKRDSKMVANSMKDLQGIEAMHDYLRTATQQGKSFEDARNQYNAEIKGKTVGDLKKSLNEMQNLANESQPKIDIEGEIKENEKDVKQNEISSNQVPSEPKKEEPSEPKHENGEFHFTSMEQANQMKYATEILKMFSDAQPNMSFEDLRDTVDNLCYGKSSEQLKSELGVFETSPELMENFKKSSDKTSEALTDFYNKSTEEMQKNFEGKAPVESGQAYINDAKGMARVNLGIRFMNVLNDIGTDFTPEEMGREFENFFKNDTLDTIANNINAMETAQNQLCEFMQNNPNATNAELTDKYVNLYGAALDQIEEQEEERLKTSEPDVLIGDETADRQHINVPEASDGFDVAYQPTKEELQEQLQADKTLDSEKEREKGDEEEVHEEEQELQTP